MAEHDEGLITRHESTFKALECRVREQENLMTALQVDHKNIMADLPAIKTSQDGMRTTLLLFKSQTEMWEEARRRDLDEERKRVKDSLEEFNGTQVLRIKDAVKEELEAGRRTTKADWKWLLAFLAAILSPYLLVYLEHTWK